METINSTNQIQEEFIQKRLSEGYKFDLVEYITKGLSIFKKEWLTFSLYTLIVLVILMTGVGVLVVYPLLLGYFVGADKVTKGEKLALGDMFSTFDKNLGSLIGLVFVPIVVIGAIYIPFIGIIAGAAAAGGDSEAASAALGGGILLMYALVFVASFALSLLLFYAPYLVYFGNYSFVDALKTSWKLSLKQPIWVILFGIVIGAIAQFGLIACGVGMIATTALGYVCYYPAIKDILFGEKVDVQ